MGADIKDLYMNTDMKCYEYMKLKLDIIPREIVLQYKLKGVTSDGWKYLEIRKGMYGLPQAGILVNNNLTAHLATRGYVPTAHTHTKFVETCI